MAYAGGDTYFAARAESKTSKQEDIERAKALVGELTRPTGVVSTSLGALNELWGAGSRSLTDTTREAASPCTYPEHVPVAQRRGGLAHRWIES
jgi:hypothetical protein